MSHIGKRCLRSRNGPARCKTPLLGTYPVLVTRVVVHDGVLDTKYGRSWRSYNVLVAKITQSKCSIGILVVVDQCCESQIWMVDLLYNHNHHIE
jgi:hypothetical protein